MDATIKNILEMFGMGSDPTQVAPGDAMASKRVNPSRDMREAVPARRVQSREYEAGVNYPGNYPNVNERFVKAPREGDYEYPPQIDGMESARRFDPVPTGMEDMEAGVDQIEMDSDEMEDPVSDSGNAARIDKIIDDHDVSEFSKYSGKKALTETLGLNVSPELESFWDKTDPVDRLLIIEAIQNSAGMATDEDIMNEVGRRPNNDVETDVINKMLEE